MSDQAVQRIADASQAPIDSQASAPIQETSLLSAIVRVARDPQLDVAKLDALMRMQFELEKRQAEREAIEAFARLSATMPRVKKTGVISLGQGKGEIPFVCRTDWR